MRRDKGSFDAKKNSKEFFFSFLFLCFMDGCIARLGRESCTIYTHIHKMLKPMIIIFVISSQNAFIFPVPKNSIYVFSQTAFYSSVERLHFSIVYHTKNITVTQRSRIYECTSIYFSHSLN